MSPRNSTIAEGEMAERSSTADIAAAIEISAPSKNSRPFEKKFQFIVNPDKKSRRVVRTHVMRNFWHQQRRQASQTEDPEHWATNGPIPWKWKTVPSRKSRPASVKQRKNPKRLRLGDGDSECLCTGSVPQKTKLVLGLQKRKRQKQGGLLPSSCISDTSYDYEEVPRPQTPLGAGRVDPFRSHCLDLGYRQHECFDHCMLYSIS